jgi:hypothetical protein
MWKPTSNKEIIKVKKKMQKKKKQKKAMNECNSFSLTLNQTLTFIYNNQKRFQS